MPHLSRISLPREERETPPSGAPMDLFGGRGEDRGEKLYQEIWLRFIRWRASFWASVDVNPHSQMIFRLLSKEDKTLGPPFFRERISAAAAWREKWLKGKTNAYRMVNGEGDFFLVVYLDRYGEILVLQFLTAGMD